MQMFGLRSAIVACVVLTAGQPLHLQSNKTVLFEERFEGDLRHWIVEGKNAVALRESAERDHRKVLALSPNGDVIAVIKGSERFGAVRVEGDVKFVDEENNYRGQYFVPSPSTAIIATSSTVV